MNKNYSMNESLINKDIFSNNFLKKAFSKSRLFSRKDSISKFLNLDSQENNIVFLSQKRKLIKKVLALTAWLLMICLMTENDLYYTFEDLDETPWSHFFFFHCVTFISICFACSKVISIYLYKKILILQGLRSSQKSIANWKLLGVFLVYLIHPMYIFHSIKINSNSSFPSIEFKVPLNDYIMVFQTFLLAFEILTHKLFNHSDEEERIRLKIRKEQIIAPRTFFMKFYLSSKPFQTILTILMFGVFHLSFLMKISESPKPIRSESFLTLWANCFWLAFITMLTIGYGDLHPVSYQGRIVAVALGILGYICFSLILTSISQLSNFNKSEQEVVKNLNLRKLSTRNRQKAAEVIVFFSRLLLNVKNNIAHQYLKDKTNLEVAVFKFKESKDELRRAKMMSED